MANLAESRAGGRWYFTGGDLRLRAGCGSDCRPRVGLRGQVVGACTEPVLGRPDCLDHGSLGACLDGSDAHRGNDSGGAEGTMGESPGAEAELVVAARPNQWLKLS